MLILSEENLLLEEDRSETTVEGTNTLVLEDLTETADETVGEARGGDQTDTGSLKRAEGDGSEELGGGGRDGVDGSAVLAGLLDTDSLDGLGLEELVTSELEGTLGEVTSEGRTGTGQESTSTLVLNDLAEGAEHTLVVGGGVQLDLGLDAVQWSVRRSKQRDPGNGSDLHIDGCESTVGDGAADGTGKGETGDEVGALGALLGGSGSRHCDAEV